MQRNPTKNYEIVKQIGEGAYSKVYKAVRLLDNTVVAIKIVNITKMDKIMINSTLNEIRILNSVNNDHVVGYSEAFMDASESNMWIVMEYMGGGDLACAIKLAKKENRTFPERVIWVYMIQILRGLHSLNQFKIIHRDIKPANIFLTTDHKTVKLGDLNVSKVVENDLTRTQIGTPSYLAPEIWEAKAYDSRCDIYSLGVCMYEMAALKLPFEAKTMEELKQKIRNNVISPLPSGYSEELKKVIFKCLTKNHTLRSSAEKLLITPIFQLKITEYELVEQREEEKGKLMDTIVFPNKISLLKNLLPKKSHQQKRSSSAANLKVSEIKNDSFVSKKEIPLSGIKSDAKSFLNVSGSKVEIEKYESSKKQLLPPVKCNPSTAQNIDPTKINMSKMNSKQEPVIEVIQSKKNMPIQVEVRPSSSKNVFTPPIKETKQKNGINPDSLDKFDKILMADNKKIVPVTSQKELPIQLDNNKNKTPLKNVPPSPQTKIEAIKHQVNGSNRETPQQLIVKPVCRNSSASAKRLEPIVEDKKESIKRQNSASRLSSANVSKGNLSTGENKSKGKESVKAPVKNNEKPLPPSVSSFKKPPAKSMIGQQRSSQNEVVKVERYSTNPSNRDLRRNDSKEKIMKFDDFIKNFEDVNGRMNKPRPRQPESQLDAKAPRFSSVKKR